MTAGLKILALEPYYGGSHQQFLDTWSQYSRHAFDILGLPAHKWKWRMRHAPITLAAQVKPLLQAGKKWDALFCSDMLNLAEFMGLAPPALQQLPAVIYFHENQLTYPSPADDPRDHHFAFSNLTSALAATSVWFNSDFHRASFLSEMSAFLRRMPDYRPLQAVEAVRAKASIHYPAVQMARGRVLRSAGPMQVLWAARWEHDKNPEDFFAALGQLEADRVDYRLHVVGQSFRATPAVFERARRQFTHRIDTWGYLHKREDYERVVRAADVIVSTAQHEFFGISVVEAVLAGAIPLVPSRLSYPELFADLPPDVSEHCIYDGSVGDLAGRLRALSILALEEREWRAVTTACQAAVARLAWEHRVPEMDDALELVVS